MKEFQPTALNCHQLLSKWRENLQISYREKSLLKGELINLDKHIHRLNERRLRISVFGRVGVGKSSLLNALLSEEIFATDVAHGCTRQIQTIQWEMNINQLKTVELLDTPGIDEISAAGRGRLAARIALQSDLILLVLDGDINHVELNALQALLRSGKPIVVVLNRCDQWTPKEKNELIKSIRNRLPKAAQQIQIEAVSAAPREVHLINNQKVRSHRCKPKVEGLRKYLIQILAQQGELLLALNTLRLADHFQNQLKQVRLKQNKTAAQGLIGRFAAIKASGIAANPLLLFDLAAGIAFDTALVMQLCKIYGIQMGGPAARRMLTRLSGHSILLGSAQLGIQLALSSLRQLLLIAAPFSGGLTLAPAAPVAIVQAVIAVHTTKLTGRMAATELMRGSNRRMAIPTTMLKYLANSDPQAKNWLGEWPIASQNERHYLKAFLP